MKGGRKEGRHFGKETFCVERGREGKRRLFIFFLLLLFISYSVLGIIDFVLAQQKTFFPSLLGIYQSHS